MSKANMAMLRRDMDTMKGEMEVLKNLVARMENSIGCLNSRCCEIDGQNRRMDRISDAVRYAVSIEANKIVTRSSVIIMVDEILKGLDEERTDVVG